MGIERVTNQALNISKVANYISHEKGLVNELGAKELGCHEIDIGIGNITTYVTLLEKKEITLSRDVSLEDMAVMDVVASLYVSGITSPSLDYIARLLSSDKTKRPSQEKLKRISDSIKKMCNIHIEIDITKVLLDENKIETKQKAIYEGALLHIDSVEISEKGDIVEKTYRVATVPVLYAYASSLGHIVTVPSTLLETGDTIPKNIRAKDEFVLLKREIVKRIEIMKNNKNNYLNTKIVYERYEGLMLKGFFKDMGYEAVNYSNWPVKRSKLHKMIVAILEDLINKGEISGYTILKEQKKIYGVDICFDKPIRKKRKG